MKYKIIYGNHHSNAVQSMDTMMMIKLALLELGIHADFEKNVQRGCVNIIQEFFTDEYVEYIYAEAMHPNTQIILVVTEFITGSTFNDFSTLVKDIKGGYGDRFLWRNRYENFKVVASLSTAIWTLSEHQLVGYQEICGADKVFYLPHAYIEAMQTVRQREAKDKNIDFLFTGSMTAYRTGVLEQLAEEHSVVATDASTPAHLREDFIARSRIGLNIIQYEGWQYLSNSRMHYHLMNHSVLIAQQCEYGCDLGKYIFIFDQAHFVEQCLNLLEQTDTQQKFNEKCEAFKHEMPMLPIMEKLLDMSHSA